ncbi:hypothetical protein GZ77_16290 [Endozoicomonas montiporae]|uniref:DUF2029 domain-containing protein n=2 Tax=Endozoicomonas montiporae TaxID=1027273 RepID=A0A081N5V4_9GAMM|nr:glycosyltransferase family 87 protein [Endozoicomonas montiporae]AMO57266.1 hypothetical protein EZMO1_3267 [Endozoicomonas montiporae CL-33]KEQ13827.1 hypothetical protein GZ77_16290 [Endozoicomonas montiporae]
MPPDNFLKNTTTFEKLGLFLWLLALILIFAKVVLEPGSHSVVDSYLLGGQRWVDRVALYSGPGGFIYTPLFALLFTPFLHISEAMTDLLWRLFIIFLYLYSLIALIRMISDAPAKTMGKWLGMMSIIAVPIAFSGFRNGQVNVILTAVMVLVVCQIAEKRWNSAAILLALVMSLKPTFIVFFLLTTTLFRPLWLRVPVLLLFFLALPMLFGGWQYGWQQYINFIEMAQSAMHHGVHNQNFASLFNVFQVFGVFISDHSQHLIKVILAGATWLLCWFAIRQFDTKTALLYLLTFASCYHLMFNPRSVNTDYIILGTVLALWFTCAIYLWNNKRLALAVGLISLGVLEAFDLSRTLVPGSTSWVNPLMGLLFSILVIWQLFQKRTFVKQTSAHQPLPDQPITRLEKRSQLE